MSVVTYPASPWPTIRRFGLRWRRELTPPLVALALLSLGWLCTATGGPYSLLWALVVVLGVATWRGLSAARRQRGGWLQLSAGALACLWLMIDRVTHSLHPITLMVGTAILAGPWAWQHRVRRDPPKVPIPPLAEHWDERVAAVGGALVGSALLDVRAVKGVEHARSATLWMPPGTTLTTAVRATETITSALELPIGSVTITQHPSGIANQARVLVTPISPLTDGVTWRSPTLDAGRIRLGRWADGQPAHLRLWRPGWGAVPTAITGATGSGKSRTVDLMLAECHTSPLVVSWLIDPQQGQSLPDWVDAVDWAALDVAAGLRMLRAAKAVVLARSAHLARAEWVDDQGRRRRGAVSADPTPSMPLLHIVVEEAPELLASSPEAVELLASLVKIGRKTGLKVTLVAQKMIGDEVKSTTLRAMLASGDIVIHRTGDRQSGAALAGNLPVDPSTLPDLPGVGILRADGQPAMVFRADYLADPFNVAQHPARGRLDELSAQAARSVEPDYGKIIDPMPTSSWVTTSPIGKTPTARDRLVSALESGPMATADLWEAADVSKATGHRVMRSLCDEGIAVQPKIGTYALAGAE